MTSKELELINGLYNFKKSFENAMDDDFNTADAISVIFEIVKFANVNVTDRSSKQFCESVKEFIIELCSVLAININDLEQKNDKDKIDSLIEKRQEARKIKNWAVADEIRNKLSEMGVIIEDTAQGVRWTYRDR